MVRLPDIPFESWVADQQDLFTRKVQGLFPSLEFQDAANQTSSEIPADYPYVGGENTYDDDLRRIQELEAIRAQQEEEERQRQAAAAEQAMQAANMQAQQNQEMQRQEEMLMQSHQMASDLGIPLPQDVASSFEATTGTLPGTGDNLSSTGAFDPAIAPFDPQAPAQAPTTGAFENLNQERRIPTMGGVDDFMSFSSGLLSQLTPTPPSRITYPGETPFVTDDGSTPQRPLGPEVPPEPPRQGLIARGIDAASTVVGDAFNTLYENAPDMPGVSFSPPRLEGLERTITSDEAKKFLTDEPAPSDDPAKLWEWNQRIGRLTADAVLQAAGDDPDAVIVGVEINGQPYNYSMRDFMENFTNPAFAAGWGIGDVVFDAVGKKALQMAAPLLKGAAKATVENLLTPLDRAAGGAIDYGVDLTRRVGSDLSSSFNDAFRLGDNQPTQEAAGILPPETRRVFTPEAELPAVGTHDRDILEEALQNVGGRIENDEVHIGLTRAHDKALEDAPSFRSSVFFEPVAPGQGSSYIAPDNSYGTYVGGSSVMPRTETVYRKPFVVSTGDADNFRDVAIQKLGIEVEPTARLQALVDRYSAAEKAKLPPTLSPEARMQEESLIDQEYASLLTQGRGDPTQLYDAVFTVTNKVKGNKPQLDVLREVAKSWGGDPREFATMVRVDAARGTYGEVLTENIIASNARARGHDGVLVVGPDYRSGDYKPGVLEVMDLQVSHAPVSPERTPDWQQIHARYQAAEDRLRETTRAFEEEYGRAPDQEDVYAFDPELEPDGGDMLRQGDPVGVAWVESQESFNRLHKLINQTPEEAKIPEGARPGYRVFPEVRGDAPPQPFELRDTEAASPPMLRSEVAAASPTDVASEFGTAAQRAARGMATRSTVGAVTGGTAGAFAGDENTTPAERLKNIGLGAAFGAVGAQKGTMAAARFVDDMIAKGSLSPEILASHPETADRIRALFTLAAKNRPDDEVVEIPGMVQALTALDASVRTQVTDLINGPKTAGEIRQIVSETMSPRDLGREAQTFIMDLVAGTRVGAARAAETRADEATIQGIRNLNPFASRSLEVPDGVPAINTAHGVARRVDGGSLRDTVTEVARDMEVTPPVVYRIESDEPIVIANKGQTALFVSRGIDNLDLSPEARRALFQHEIAHTTEQNFGMELLGRVGQAAEDTVRRWAGSDDDLVAEAAGAVRVPARGVWRERVQNGPEIPEGITPARANDIQRNYDEAMRLLEKSQQPRLKTKNQISYLSSAHKAWEKYDAAVAVARRELETGTRAEARVSPAARQDVVPNRDAGGLSEDEQFPFGRTSPDNEPTNVASPTRPVVAEAGGRTSPDELTFDENILPERFDNPSQVVEHAEVSRLMRELNEELAMSPAVREQMEKNAVKIMAMPKPRIKHIQQLVEWVGDKQAVARGVSKEEAATQWADRFFRRHGWLAPEPSSPSRAAAISETTPAGTTPLPANVAPDSPPATPTNARIADDFVDEPTDEMLAELPDQIDELLDVPIEDMQGIIARRKVNKALQHDPDLANDAAVQMMANPTPRGTHRARGVFERMQNYWREKMVTKATDELAILQGFQNDVAREYQRLYKKPMPHDIMAASLKRLDSGRAAEMAVNDRLKPALQTFARLELPLEQVNTYLMYTHQLDVAFEKGNLTRKLPGGEDLAHAQDWITKFEHKYQSNLGAAKYAEVKTAIDQVWDFGNHLLDLKYGAGLIDDAAYKAMRKAYPHYIPTRVIDYLNDDKAVNLGKSLSINDNLIRAMTYSGTERETVTPLAALLGDAYGTYAAAQKNTVFNAFYGLWQTASQMPLPDNARGHRIEDMVAGIVDISPSASPGAENNGVTGFIDGKKIKLAVDKALGDFTRFEAATTIPLLSGLMSAFRAGATSRNPVFLTANMTLDLATYMNREIARSGSPKEALMVLPMYMKTAAEFLPVGMFTGAAAGGYEGSREVTDEDTMMTAAAKIAMGMGAGALLGAVVDAKVGSRLGNNVIRDLAQNTYSGDMKRFLAEGGGTAGAYFERSAVPVEPLRLSWGRGRNKFDLDNTLASLGYRKQSALEGNVDNLQRQGVIEINSAADLLKAIKDTVLMKPVERLGERIELVPRVAAMRLAERRGEDLLSAVNKGRTTTIDFNKGGTWARAINQVIPFFNVGVQGAADVGRAFSENPAAFSATVAATMIAPIIAAEAWNNMDEQRRKDYQDVPQYLKDQGLVVMLPTEPTIDAQGNRHPQFFHFRYRTFAPFAVLTRELLQNTYFSDQYPPEFRRGIGEAMFEGGMQQVSPVGVGSMEEFTTNILPPVAGTLAQIAFDRDTFRGRRIVSNQGDERASPLSKALAERFGGRASQWEFGTRDVGTGFAGMAHGAAEIFAGTDRSKKNSPQERPVTGGLYGRVIKGSIGEGATHASENVVAPTSEQILKQHGIKWRPAASDPEIEQLPLTRAEYAEYQREVNQLTNDIIAEASRDPDWLKMTALEKEVALKQVLDQDRDKLRKWFLANRIDQAQAEKRMQQQEAEGKLRPVMGGRR